MTELDAICPIAPAKGIARRLYEYARSLELALVTARREAYVVASSDVPGAVAPPDDFADRLGKMIF